MNLKEYLGDSVYADFDGYHIILTTENGFGPSNTIALEPPVLLALDDYRKRLREAHDGAVSPFVPSKVQRERMEGGQ